MQVLLGSDQPVWLGQRVGEGGALAYKLWQG